MTDIRATQTNGIGSKGNTGHLNLAVTLADVWGVQPKPKIILAPVKRGRPKGPLEPTKIPYAGKGSK